MLLINNSVDDWMNTTQKNKAQEICQVMSLKVLTERSTLEELLKMFGEVSYDEIDGFRVNVDGEDRPAATLEASAEETPKDTGKAAPKSTSRLKGRAKGKIFGNPKS
jgi:hypothetical protein